MSDLTDQEYTKLYIDDDREFTESNYPVEDVLDFLKYVPNTEITDTERCKILSKLVEITYGALEQAIDRITVLEARVPRPANPPVPTPQDIKALRLATGASLADCQRTLVKFDNNHSAAAQYLGTS